MNTPISKNKKPVNQHWVPQFYLRYFATPKSRHTDNPQVWIFSKHDEDGYEKLTHVRNVCAKRFLYSPIQEDGTRNWDLDDQLGEVETLLSKRWPEFAEGFAPLGDEHVRMGLSIFVATMHMRNPAVRHQVVRMHDAVLAAFKDAPLRPDGTPDVDAVEVNGEVRSIDTSDWHDYSAWGKDDHDRFFADMVREETGYVAKMLLQMRWSVICSESEVFVTTDKPVGMHHQSKTTFGFGTPGVIITFPLGPKRMLFMDDMHHEPANQFYPLQEGNAGAINATTWHAGSRFMITGRPISDVLTEIVALQDQSRPSTH